MLRQAQHISASYRQNLSGNSRSHGVRELRRKLKSLKIDPTGCLDFLSLLFMSFLFFFAGADPTHEGTAEGMENMANAVTHARFVGL